MTFSLGVLLAGNGRCGATSLEACGSRGGMARPNREDSSTAWRSDAGTSIASTSDALTPAHIPEPSTALIGFVLLAGMLRRSRTMAVTLW